MNTEQLTYGNELSWFIEFDVSENTHDEITNTDLTDVEVFFKKSPSDTDEEAVFNKTLANNGITAKTDAPIGYYLHFSSSDYADDKIKMGETYWFIFGFKTASMTNLQELVISKVTIIRDFIRK